MTHPNFREKIRVKRGETPIREFLRFRTLRNCILKYIIFLYSQVANRRVFLIKCGGQKLFQNSINGGRGLNKWGGLMSTLKTEKFTLIYSIIIIDKACRWIMSGKNASNRSQIGVFA